MRGALRDANAPLHGSSDRRAHAPERVRAKWSRTWQAARAMASNVVNLNRFRKKKLREAEAKQAETNRILHGRTKAEKDRDRAARERAERIIEGKRLERPLQGAPTPAAPSDEPEGR